jgi:2,3-bisphosphoglycerate-independent phosphoglycerate mutase
MNTKNLKKPLMLLIFDGFGIRKNNEFNGILNSHMDYYFSLWKEFPHTKLDASGPLVGLPEGQMGSSEVGHLTLGAGRLIKQPIVRINEDMDSGNFVKHSLLEDGFKYVKRKKSNVHIMGLLGDGGVHSHQNHLEVFLRYWDSKVSTITGSVYIHNFLDGRDTAQESAQDFMLRLEKFISTLENKGRFIISTMCGRYYAMDRDKRDERTSRACNLLVNGDGENKSSWNKAIKESYSNKIYDEFFEPTILNLEPITKNDLIQFYNFRADRPQQLTKMFLDTLKDVKIQTLTEYNPNFDVNVFYPIEFPKQTFGEILTKNKLTQLRIAESEKYPHVTYFFNGLNIIPGNNEVQVKIPSPKVATYDLQPEMNSQELTDRVCREIKENKHDFILLNFANSDMVGHTGNYEAIKKALSALDVHLKDIKETLDSVDGTLLITADHGNCETMRDENGKPHTKHTYNKVPFIICKKGIKLSQKEEISLYNVAPTMLDLLGLKKPKEMSGESLILK